MTSQSPLLEVDHLYDAVIIGGGPSGSACAFWLAKAGWDVRVFSPVEGPLRKKFEDAGLPVELLDAGGFIKAETAAPGGPSTSCTLGSFARRWFLLTFAARLTNTFSCEP